MVHRKLEKRGAAYFIMTAHKGTIPGHDVRRRPNATVTSRPRLCKKKLKLINYLWVKDE